MAAHNRPQFPAPEPPLPSAGNASGEALAPKTLEEQVKMAGELDNVEPEPRSRTFVIAGIALLMIAAAVAIVSFTTRPKPAASGSINEAYAVALPDNAVLATIKVSFNNIGGKTLWVRDIKAQLTDADGKQYTDIAANAVDFDRYFRGYPDLRDHSIAPLRVETKVDPREQVRGSVIVSFPVTLDSFSNRKSLAVMIYPYASAMAPGGGDQRPLVITQGH